MPDHSISISEPEQVELYAPQCTTKQAAATFTSNEARESFSKSQNEIKTARKKFNLSSVNLHLIKTMVGLSAELKIMMRIESIRYEPIL